MPQRTNKLALRFNPVAPGKNQPPLDYSYSELSRLTQALSAVFSKINQELAENATEGEDSSEEDLAALTIRVANLENQVSSLSTSIQAIQTQLLATNAGPRLTALENTVGQLSSTVNGHTERIENLEEETRRNLYIEPVAEAVPFLAYTAQVFEFDYADSGSNFGRPFCWVHVNSILTTLPIEIEFAGCYLDSVNYKLYAKFINNTPTDVLWPECLVYVSLQS